jgi:hypothetical protein
MLEPLRGVGGRIPQHAYKLERPERAVPADALQPPNGDEIVGITQDPAQIGSQSRSHR